MRMVAVLFPGVDRDAAQAEIESWGARVVEATDMTGRWMLTLEGPASTSAAIAHVMDVQWIEVAPDPGPRNNTTAWVIQTFVSGDTKVWTKGLLGANQVIGHIDGGLALSSCYFSDPSGAFSRPHSPLAAEFDSVQSGTKLPFVSDQLREALFTDVLTRLFSVAMLVDSLAR